MGESTSQIERDIAEERNELGRNLQLLEHKARSLADWRAYFRSHPFAMMGAALGGGLLLGALTGGISRKEMSEDIEEPPEHPRRFDEPRSSAPTLLSSSAALARGSSNRLGCSGGSSISSDISFRLIPPEIGRAHV